MSLRHSGEDISLFIQNSHTIICEAIEVYENNNVWLPRPAAVALSKCIEENMCRVRKVKSLSISGDYRKCFFILIEEVALHHTPDNAWSRFLIVITFIALLHRDLETEIWCIRC